MADLNKTPTITLRIEDLRSMLKGIYNEYGPEFIAESFNRLVEKNIMFLLNQAVAQLIPNTDHGISEEAVVIRLTEVKNKLQNIVDTLEQDVKAIVWVQQQENKEFP